MEIERKTSPLETNARPLETNAHPLETNAHANFPMAENAAYQCMVNGGGKHVHIETFVAHCACRVQC